MLNLMVCWPSALFASHMLGDGGGGCIEVDGAWLRAQAREAVATYFLPLTLLAGLLAWRRPVAPP